MQNLYGVRGSILKMEMGLGKTLTAIAWCLLAPRRDSNAEKLPTLVVASKTVMGVWKRDAFEKFGVDAKVLYFHRDFLSSAAMEGLTRAQLLSYDFVVTTYDVIVYAAPKELRDTPPAIPSLSVEDIDDPSFKGRAVLFYTPWERVIADESQRFANPRTHAYKAMMCLFGYTKLCLTGTPIRNYSTDLWAQLRFCGYTGTMKESEWKRSFSSIIPRHRLLDVILSQGYEETDIILPDKVVHPQHVVLTGVHKQVYDYVLGVVQDVYDEMLSSKVSTMCILALFLLLRLTCIAPYLLTDQSKRLKNDTYRDVTVARKYLSRIYDKEYPLWNWVKQRFGEAGVASAKLARVVEIIEDTEEEEKVIVFSMFTCSLDLLKDALEEKGKTWGNVKGDKLKVLQLDGDTPSQERQELINTFKTDPSAKVLLMTYKTGGEGINLTCANHIIELEPWWTDSVHLQSEARAWRAGQTRIVHVHRLYIKDSIEEHVLGICAMKNELILRMFGEKPGEGIGGLSMATLGFLIGKKTSLKAPKRFRRGNKKDKAALRSATLRYYDVKFGSPEDKEKE